MGQELHQSLPRKQQQKMTEILSKLETLLQKRIEKRKERLQKAEAYNAVVKETEALGKDIRELQRQHASFSNRHSITFILPVEILSLIFEYVCARSDWGIVSIPKRQPMEIRLCQVARFWRDTAVQDPKLWTTFYSSGLRPSEICRFSSYLKRSCNQLLDLKFEGAGSLTLQTMLELAAENAMRWRKISFRITHAEYLGEFYNILAPKSIPHLEFLELCIMTATPQKMTFEGGAPKISCPYMDSWTFLKSFPSFKFVTGINIQHANSHDFAQFLDLLKLENLENLSILKSIFGRPSGDLSPVCAPNLKYLRSGDMRVQENMWELVRAPKLEVLIFRSPTLVFNVWRQAFVMENVDDMATPHIYPSLHTVALINASAGQIGFKSLQKIAYGTKNAKQLYITDSYCERDRTSSVISLLGQNSRSKLLWPELEQLYCTTPLDWKPERYNFTKYLDVVRVRSQVLGKHCKLLLPRREAENWKSESPETWRQLVEGGFYEEIPMNQDGSPLHGLDIIPWPPRDRQFADIKDLNSYERQFLSYDVV